jgi:hypothetical protein
MTMILELEGRGRKAGHVCAPDYRRGRGCPLIVRETSEDVLTANVFGVLRNLPPRLWLRPLLNSAFRTSRFSSISMRALDISFWQRVSPPSLRTHEEGWTEVDVLIRFGDEVVFVECKYRAGLSPGTKYDPQRNQLIRLVDCAWHYAIEGMCFPRRPPHILVIGTEREPPNLVTHYQESGALLEAIKPSPPPTLEAQARVAAQRVGYASWGGLGQLIQQHVAKGTGVEQRFLGDVVRYIERKMDTARLDSAQRRQLSLLSRSP